MPRKARVVSKTNIYHVMLRGVNQQIIFEDEEDFRYFISILSMCRDICGYTIFAYCLMNNHIHLLMEPNKNTLCLFTRLITLFLENWMCLVALMAILQRHILLVYH